jgi:hypothetical protein
MALPQIQTRGPHPQIANFPFAELTMEALLTPSSNAEKARLEVMEDERQEKLDGDPLGPARGIINGLRLSVTLWSFIALVVLLMR